MKRRLNVPLRTIKEFTRDVRLSYVEDPLQNRQARLANRVTLTPEIDLGAYTCRAVLDYVDVCFELGRETQFHHLQRLLESIVGNRPYVVGHYSNPGENDHVFNVRFQEPRLHLLRQCAQAVGEKYGHLDAPYVYNLEVSVDFTPKVPSREARARMVGVLSRHLFPKRNMLAKPGDRPRVAWGIRKSETRHLLHQHGAELDRNSAIDPETDRWLPVDATYYIGRKLGLAMWRVMDKVIDRQDPARDIYVDLPEEKKRARVEVRLDRLELKKLGIVALDDLLGFNFGTLQGSHFQFVLPTFHPRDGIWRHLRQQRFVQLGILGLMAMDDERARLRKGFRPGLIRRLRTRGKKVLRGDRQGSGRLGSFVAYDKLNDRVSMALRKLTERESSKLKT